MLVARPCTFFYEEKFKKAVRDFGPSSAAYVWGTIHDFEEDWRYGMDEKDLFKQYNFKMLREIYRPYKIYQIRAGLKRKQLNYRVEMMFEQEKAHVYWIHAFKKDPNPRSKKQDISLVIARSDEVWSSKIKGGR